MAKDTILDHSFFIVSMKTTAKKHLTVQEQSSHRIFALTHIVEMLHSIHIACALLDEVMIPIHIKMRPRKMYRYLRENRLFNGN